MASRVVNQAYPTDGSAVDRNATGRRTPKDHNTAGSERKRAEESRSAAGSEKTYSEPGTEYLQRQMQSLKAKLAISELERLSERQTSEHTIKSLRAINEELSKALSEALEAKPASTPSDLDEPRLREDRAILWDTPDAEWEDNLDAEPRRRKMLWKVLRAASPI